MYWAQALAEQSEDKELQDVFKPVALQLTDNENKIIEELNTAQGIAVDLGGYYRPDREVTSKVMRPSKCLNAIIDNLK